ncbi:MAG: DUF58 domain-containing protein [Lachnospiraceae bacterium]|nr:DUF58 domain-containing protein [Lachnospiraceae bacterium]
MCNLIIGVLIAMLCVYLGILYVNTNIIFVGITMGVLLLSSILELLYRFFTLQYQLEVPISMTEEHTPTKICLRIRNRGIFATGRVMVRMTIHNVLEKQQHKKWFHLDCVFPKERCYDFKVVLHGVGKNEIEVTKIRIYSLFGLLYMEKKWNQCVSVLVMPEVHAIHVKLTENTRNFLGDADVYDDIRIGYDPSEVFEVRPYREKDKIQSIHWKLSAKMDDLMVKENSLPKACAVVLFPDFRWEKKKENYINEFLELTASVSFCLMDSKCPHFVAWYSKQKEDIIRIRVDDEESFYLFLNYYLEDVNPYVQKDIVQEYQQKYKNEYYLHTLCIKGDLKLYKDGEYWTSINAKKLEDECKELELLL